MTKPIVILGDTHFPWVNKKALNKAYKLIEELQPSHVIQIGDLYDNYNFSKYRRYVTLMSAQEEITKGRKMAKKMWNTIQEIVPDAKCYQLLGNHDARIEQRVLDKFPEILFLLNLKGLWKFKGVKTMESTKDELFLHDICIIHGHRSSLGDHANFNMMNTACGHSHIGGTVFLRNKKEIFWELNAGWLGDEMAPVFNYPPQKKIRKGTLGLGVIEKVSGKWVPKFVQF